MQGFKAESAAYIAQARYCKHLNNMLANRIIAAAQPRRMIAAKGLDVLLMRGAAAMLRSSRASR